MLHLDAEWYHEVCRRYSCSFVLPAEFGYLIFSRHHNSFALMYHMLPFASLVPSEDAPEQL